MRISQIINKVLLATLLLVLASCGNEKSDDWVVKINNAAITKDDMQLRWSNITPENQKQISNPVNYVLNDLIKNEIFFQEAQKAKLDASKDYKAYINRLTKQYEYQKKQVLVEFFLREKVAKNIQVTEQEVAAAYDANKARFFSGFEQRAFSHILVKTQADASAVIKELNKGVSFDAIAKTKSLDVATGANGGRLPGLYRKDVLNPDLSSTIFSLKRIGQISKPTKSDAGLHIVRLDDIQQVQPRTYEQVKAYLQQQIFVKKRNDELAKLFNSVKDDYKQTVNPKNQEKAAETKEAPKKG